MAKTEVGVEATSATAHNDGWSTAGVVFGALGALAAVWAYWMIVPGIVCGIAAIVLGIRARRRYAEAGSVADRARHRRPAARALGARRRRRSRGLGSGLRPEPVEPRLLIGSAAIAATG